MADMTDGFRFDTVAIDEMERVLLERKLPLIDLGLARYGRSAKVVGGLFRRSAKELTDADIARGVRLACLSNPMEPMSSFSSPGGITMEEFEAVALGDCFEEAQQLLKNPAAGRLLAKLYSRRAPFDTIPDARFMDLVQFSINNPRISIDESNEYGIDGLGYDIQRGILNLVLTVPIDAQWLRCLHSLLMQLDPGDVATPNETQAREAVSRWASLEMDEAGSDADKTGCYTDLSLVDEFRCLVAAIYGRWWDPQAKRFGMLGAPASGDAVLRCSFYGNATTKELSPKVVEAELEHYSTQVFAFAALWNNNVLLDKGLRATLESHLHEYLKSAYVDRCNQLARRYKEFDRRPVSDELSNRTSDAATHTLDSLASDIAKLDAKLTAAATGGAKTAVPTWFYWVTTALLTYLALRR
jgi:hypothetical protein